MWMHQNLQKQEPKRKPKSKIVTTREASKTARHCEQACSQHGQRPINSPLRVMFLARRVDSVGQLRIPRPLTHINSPIIFLNHPLSPFPYHFRFYTLSHQKIFTFFSLLSSLTLNLQSLTKST
jgi:hypothetical protein